MIRRVLQILVALVIVTFAAGTFHFLSTKWEEANAEAKTRCADPAVRKDRNLESCISEMMSYYHMNSRLPNVVPVVSAQQQSQERTKPSPYTTAASLLDTVPDNVYTFTPAHHTEELEEDQLDRLLRNLSEKYRILDIEIIERGGQDSFGRMPTVSYIHRVRIVVQPK